MVPAVAVADGAAPAQATPVQKQQAMDHFASGKRALSSRQWEKAVAELHASLELVDSPNARLELARALRESGQPGEAWTEFDRVVDDARRLSASEPRYGQTADAAAAERGELEPRLAFVLVSLSLPEREAVPAILRVAGRAIPSSRWHAPIVAPIGVTDIVLLDAGGRELARKTVPTPAGQMVSVSLEPHPPAPAPAEEGPVAPHASTAPSAPVAPRSDLRPYAYVAGGIGVAGVAAFAIFGLLSNSDYQDLKSACPTGPCPPTKASEISDGRAYQTVANIGLAVGVAGLAAGATLFGISLSGGHSGATGLVVGPGYVGLRGAL